MFCKECGRNNPEGQTVCSFCGTPLGAGPETPGESNLQMNFGELQAPAAPQAPVQAPNAYTPTRSAAPAEKKNFIALIGAIVGLVGIFLPFWHIDISVGLFQYKETFSMFADNRVRGIIAIAACITCIYSALKNIPSSVLGSGILFALMSFLEYRALDNVISDLSGKENSAEAIKLMKEGCSTGTGCPVVFIAAAIMVIGGIIGKVSEKK